MNKILSIENLSIGYTIGRKKNPLHTGLTADIETGELVCLAGPNGAGKSTLLKTIAGILPALDGKVYIDALDVRHYSSK